MDKDFPHIALYFTKNFDEFCDVLQCVLRYIALRFTKKWKVKYRRNVSVSIWKQLHFYIETHEKLDISPSVHRHFTTSDLSIKC